MTFLPRFYEMFDHLFLKNVTNVLKKIHNNVKQTIEFYSRFSVLDLAGSKSERKTLTE